MLCVSSGTDDAMRATHPALTTVLGGLAAGALATIPMSLAMEALHRRLPWRERYPLPPRQVTMRLARRLRLERHLGEPERTGVTLLAHFGYGAAGGAVYASLASWLPMPPIAGGTVFGVLVWLGSYLGWLPAMGILAPATRHPARRNALMIGAHLLWGATTGLLVARLQPAPPSAAGSRLRQDLGDVVQG